MATPVTDQGRVPFVLKVGVTGHRKLADPARITAAVREALQLIRSKVPPTAATEVVLVAVSALAGGSDLIVAHEILKEPGGRLDVALPMARTEYARDFADDASKEEFRSMLALARHIWQAPEVSDRDEAYERAGRYVVDHCDVLICVWDGLPARGRGGTQQIMSYARRHGVPLIWITTSGEPKLRPDLSAERMEHYASAVKDLDEYNLGVIKHSTYAAHVEREIGYFGLGPKTNRPVQEPLRANCQEVADWVIPFFVRSDVIAVRHQRIFQVVSFAMFALAALAVAVVSIQVTFWPVDNWIVVFEVVFLLFLLGVILLRDRIRLHDRWVSHRFLAERLRSAYFLALAGTGDRAFHRNDQISFSDPSVTWIERALAYITADRPRSRLADDDSEQLREYLNSYWIEEQLRYHTTTAYRHRKWAKRLQATTVALFAITLVSAILHLLDVGHHHHSSTNLAELLIVLSISVPAIGSAVHGIETQGMYRHHSERCKRMADLLNKLSKHMTEADSLHQIQLVAIDVERIMREESNDWFGVMRFHDVELLT